MIRLRLQNFGPIRGGFSATGGFMEITPVTVFCGNQATGKSTVAKLYATLSWLEKALVRMDFDVSSVAQEHFFRDYLKNQRIDEYLMRDTEIAYEGNAYRFTYKKQRFSVTGNSEAVQYYKRPKIMYVPSERNLLTTLEDVEKIRNLPVMLSVLFDEYQKARKSLAQTEYHLPVSDIKIRYDAQKNVTSVMSQDDRSISITSASSGIQSVTPLSIVSRYLSGEVASSLFENVQKLSSYEREQVRKFIQKSCGKDIDVAGTLIQQFDAMFLTGKDCKIVTEENTVLKSALLHFFNTCFINIVEEPEQNLYPDSQKGILYELLAYKNANAGNRLVITTHSPYIISYLTLAAKAAELLAKHVPAEKIGAIVPEESAVSGDEITIYETGDDGTIRRLEPYENLPSDGNVLNVAMDAQNEQFARLLELEEALCG